MSKTDKIMVTNDGRNCSALEITVKVSHMGQQQQQQQAAGQQCASVQK